jgi:L-asparagine transporter-like permease
MRFPYPSREPTPSEYAVLVVFVAAALIIVGIVALVMGFRAPADKHEVAVALEHRGFVLLGVGVAIAIAYWLFRRLRDY